MIYFFDELLIFSYILIKLTKKKYSETDLIIIMNDIYIVSESRCNTLCSGVTVPLYSKK